MRQMLAAGTILLLATACQDFFQGFGRRDAFLKWHFDPGLPIGTRSGGEIPDTNDFILTVSDAKGNILYNGPYGHSPEALTVEPGSYNIDVKSIEFTVPSFDKPQYGDGKVVVVRGGETADVRLDCQLRNAGIRLKVEPEFLTAYPRGTLLLKSAEGKLMYSFTEKRTAYFRPGAVHLILSDGGKDETLSTRDLAAREIWTIGISVPETATVGGKGFKIELDTVKVWKSDSFIISGSSSESPGGSGGSSEWGEDLSDALSVSMAKAAVGMKETWVFGYIVGGDLTTTGSKMNTGPDFSKNTHFAIAARASATEKSSCLSVELPKGPIRDALNLVDHPDLVGSRVYLKGNIVEPYFGITGVKGCTEYILK